MRRTAIAATAPIPTIAPTVAAVLKEFDSVVEFWVLTATH